MILLRHKLPREFWYLEDHPEAPLVVLSGPISVLVLRGGSLQRLWPSIPGKWRMK